MGMYAHGPYVEDMKMTGLLATCVIEAAGKWGGEDEFQGVELKDGLLAGGVVSLKREEVRCVVTLMREKLLDGHAGSCNGWAKSMEPINGHAMPLINLQDIYRFATDVRNFELLCTWLNHTEEEEIYWA